MKISTILPVAALGAASLAAAAFADEGGRRFTVQMTGAAERPGPGDPDGTGTAVLRVNAGQRQVCYTLTVRNIDPATAAHIHRTPPDPGPVVVPLNPPTSGSSSGCATVTRELAQQIIQNPTIFYVNVHNAPFPAGAIRGNLSR
jgi:CHRD domain-containing protein